MPTIILQRKQGSFGFDAVDEAGHVLHTDSSAEAGGHDYGFRPMQLLLAALGSCSGIDIAAILEKQRQAVTAFTIELSGEREPDVIPSLWKNIHITFHLHGAIEETKAKRAAQLSMNTYCSVAETLRRAGTEITYDVVIHP